MTKKEKRSSRVEAKPQWVEGRRGGYYVAALSFSSISSDIPLSRGGQASEWV